MAGLIEEFKGLLKEVAVDQKKILTQLEEDCQTMSEVPTPFATSLLEDLGIKVIRAPLKENSKKKKKGKHAALKFDWSGGEGKNTVGAVLVLEELVAANLTVTYMEEKCQVHIIDVHHKLLDPIQGYQRRLTGKTDALIRLKQVEMDTGSKFAWALGAVEFKTDKEDLNFFQQVFELIALSRMSQFEKGVVLLGTDLNAKWQVLHFTDPIHILCDSYQCGTDAIFQLQKLLETAPARIEKLKACSQRVGQLLPFAPSLASVNEAGEQDLKGYNNVPMTKADQIQSMYDLERVFSAHGVRVDFPGWFQPTREPPFGIYA